MSLITKKEFDNILKSYNFSCRKSKKYYKDMYTKSYQFDLTKTIFDLFEHNKSFGIRQKCNTLLDCKISTRRDRKSSKIIPILTIYKMVEPKIGITIEKSENEAKELLNDVLNFLKEKYIDIISEKRKHQKASVDNVLKIWSNSLTKETPEYKKLLKKYDKLDIEIKQTYVKLKNIESKQKTKNILDTCIEVKNNNYTIPEEEIEKVICSIEYFEKDIIKEVVDSNINVCKKILRRNEDGS
jgi:hypothetical protein